MSEEIQLPAVDTSFHSGETPADRNKRIIKELRDRENARKQMIAERGAERRQQANVRGGKKAKENKGNIPRVGRPSDLDSLHLDHSGRRKRK